MLSAELSEHSIRLILWDDTDTEKREKWEISGDDANDDDSCLEDVKIMCPIRAAVLMYLVRFVAAKRIVTPGVFNESSKQSVRKFSKFAGRTMRIETDGQTNMITVHPDEGKHSASVILMHGAPTVLRP